MPRIIVDVYTKMSKYAVTLYTGKHVAIKNRPQESGGTKEVSKRKSTSLLLCVDYGFGDI